MKTITSAVILSLLLAISFFIPKFAFASTHTLSGHVQDSSGVAIGSGTVEIKDANTDIVIATTIINSLGNYSINIDEGTYNIQITPASGSGYSSAVASKQVIASDTILNFVLTPVGTILMNGHLRDALGNALPNQNIRLDSEGTTIASATTDNNGFYSLSVAPGVYTLFISFVDTNNLYNTARNYTIRVTNFSLTQSNENQELTLPFKKVDVQI